MRVIKDSRPSGWSPVVSVVIPARNEANNLGACLTAVQANLRDAASYEVIVVDNDSSDSTIDVANSFSVDVVAAHSQTIAYGRNVGATLARGELLLFLDADVIVTSEWRCRILEVLGDLRVGKCQVYGSTYCVRDQASWVENCWFRALTDLRRGYLNGGHIIIRKRCFDEMGGFDVKLQTGEDVDLSARASARGFVITDDPRAKVIHLGYPSSAKTFFLRELWHGVGDVSTWSRFLGSRVALLATASFYPTFVLGTAGLLTGNLLLTLLSPVPLTLGSCVLVAHKFGVRGQKRLLLQRLSLAYTYIVARSLSPFYWRQVRGR